MSTTLANVSTALTAARTDVFRFEGRQDYPDDPAWMLHQAGHDWTADPDLDDWCALLRRVTRRGVTWRRVHSVVEPWTPYLRHEIEEQYPVSARHGEQIGLTPLFPPGLPDFWLIDRRAFLLHYDDTGLVSVDERTDWVTRLRLRRYRDELCAAADWTAVPALA